METAALAGGQPSVKLRSVKQELNRALLWAQLRKQVEIIVTISDPDMEVHTLTIERDVPTRDSAGGLVENFSTSNRGTLLKSVKGRAILMSQREKLEHGVRGELLGWKFLIPKNPSITLQDRITFDYVKDQSHTVKVIVGSHARSADEAFYRVIGQEDSSET